MSHFISKGFKDNVKYLKEIPCFPLCVLMCLSISLWIMASEPFNISLNKTEEPDTSLLPHSDVTTSVENNNVSEQKECIATLLTRY